MSYECSWKGHISSASEIGLTDQIPNDALRHRAALPPVALSAPALDDQKLRLGHVQEGPEELWVHPHVTSVHSS